MQNKIHSFSLTRGQSYYCGVCCVCCTEPWRHRARFFFFFFKVVNGCSAPHVTPPLSQSNEKCFSPAWCLRVICRKMCDKQIGKHFLFFFLIFPLAKPLVEQHEKCSFHDRSNLAIAAAGSLETIFRASSHTLQVPPRNGHLFIISPPELAPSINSAS